MGGGSGRDSTPSAVTNQASPSPSLATPSLGSGSTMEPPAKRPKLKLNVRPPSHESSMRSQSPDTIAVGKPRRDSSLKKRYSEGMEIDQRNTNAVEPRQKGSPAASSDLSSLSSVPPENEQVAVKEPPPTLSKSRDYGRGFMSYYVDGGDDDDIEVEDDPPAPPPKPVPPRKTEPPKPLQLSIPPPLPPQETRFKHHTVPPPYPPAKAHPPPRPPPPPVPQVNLIDTIKPTKGPREPDTVAVMIKKLEHLSRTLTDFGGVPPVPQSPGAKPKSSKYQIYARQLAENYSDHDKESKPLPKPQARPMTEKKGGAVDDFLAMFDDDESDEKDEVGADDSDIDSNLNYRLPTTSDQDGPLKYGIVFIQNALRSWAYQRVSSQVAQQYQQMQMQTRTDPPKRGPGRPRKFDNGDEQSSFPQHPPVYQFDLARTPEGAAIVAFQEVLDSGCLHLNCSLPMELSRALRHLYIQIDHLINQGSRNEPQWRCMSYGSQITAHRIRVEKWKEQQARAQQEMARQQQLANIQVMQQMGLPPNVPRVPMTAEQAQHAHAIELERRRGLQHVAQQPHLTKYITNPMSLDTNGSSSTTAASNTNKTSATATTTASNTAALTAAAVAKAAAAQSPIAGASTKPPQSATENPTPNANSINSPIKSPLPDQANTTQNTPTTTTPKTVAELASAHLDKIKMYMPNYLPRSGTQMKFSFAPTSELALKAFGKDAFPNSGNTISSIPNRGPMNISTSSPTISSNSQRQPNGDTPVLGSNVPAQSALSLQREESDTIEVAMKPSVRRDSQSQNKDGKSVPLGKDGKALPSQSSMMGSFNAVNAPTLNGRSNSVSDSTSKVPATTNSNSNANASNNAANLSSRFPHPGAVVVDQ